MTASRSWRRRWSERYRRRRAARSQDACTLLYPFDGLRTDSADAADAPDAAGDDAGAHDAAGDSADDAGPNLEPNATFETGADGWIALQGTLAVSATAHGGAKSMRVCTNVAGTTTNFSGDDNLSPGSAIIGASYRARAWVRTDPGGIVPGPLQLGLRTVNKDVGFVVKDPTLSTPVALDATWRQLEVTLDVIERGLLNVTASAMTAPGACFLLDDVALQRIR